MNEPSAPAIAAAAGQVEPTQLEAAYRLVSLLLSNPDSLDKAELEGLARSAMAGLDVSSVEAAGLLADFMGAYPAISGDEYLATLELSPACPPYLGHYAFDTPNNCAGVGHSGRNEYLIELINLYRHFGVEMDHGELADYLPAMVEFSHLTLAEDRAPERRTFLGDYLLPYLPGFIKALKEKESPYLHLARALGLIVELDLARYNQGGAS